MVDSFSSASSEACQCIDLRPEPSVIEGAGEFRLLHKAALICNICGRRWRPKGFGSKGETIYRRETAAESFRNVWIDLGYKDAHWLAQNLLDTAMQINFDAKTLHVGLSPLILSFDRGGEKHVVVTDEDVSKLKPILTRTEFVPTTWRPAYGDLYKGFIFIEQLTTEWLEVAKKHLAGGGTGGFYLFGDAMKSAEDIAKPLGLRIVPQFPRTTYEYITLEQNPEPLGAGPGTELIEDLKTTGMPHCQLCHEAARRMNALGVDGCRKELDSIVEEILPRAVEWWNNTGYRKKLKTWWASGESVLLMLSDGVKSAKTQLHRQQAEEKLKAMLRIHVKAQVIKAIDRAEKNNAMRLSGSGETGKEG